MQAIRNHLAVLMTMILFAIPGFAASVLQVKGTKALLVLEGMPMQPGAMVYAVNAEQKRKGLLRITQVKGDKAVAEITQGTAQPGMSIVVKSAGGGGGGGSTPVSTDADTGSSYRGPSKKSNKGWGLLGGLAMSNMALTAKTSLETDNLALKGTSFNVKGFYDYPMSTSFNLRGATGLETLVVTGSTTTNVCNSSTSCQLSINYLTFELSGQYNLMNSGTRIWVGGGFGFLVAASQSNNITNLSAATTNQVILLSTGADFKVGNTSFIPVVFEYGLFPFAGITLSSIYLRGGWGWRF